MPGQTNLELSSEYWNPKRTLQLEAARPIQPNIDVLVLGMHRSGTSALSGALDALGFHVPPPHIPTTSDNPSGFYENALVRDFNEHVLEVAGSSWHDPLPVPSARFEPHRGSLEARLTDLLRQDGFTRPCLLKDPRLCVTADLWLAGLARCGRPVGCILMGRHPSAVAASLQARNGLSTSHALALWVKHVLSAERLTRGQLRTFAVYDDLLRDWPATVSKILEDLGLGAVDLAEQESVDAFLRRDLRHHDSAGASARDPLEDLCLAIWDCFVDLARQGESQGSRDRLSRLEERYTESISLLAPLLDRSLTERIVVARNQPELDGSRLRVVDTTDVWLVFHGQRHRITSPYVYDALFSGIDKLVTVERVADIEVGSPLAAGACLIRAAGRDPIYLLNQTDTRAVIRHHLVSLRTFRAFGFDASKVKTVPSLLVDLVPEGREIRSADDG